MKERKKRDGSVRRWKKVENSNDISERVKCIIIELQLYYYTGIKVHGHIIDDASFRGFQKTMKGLYFPTERDSYP